MPGLHVVPGSPWESVDITVLREKPHEETSWAPGQVRLSCDAGPRATGGLTGQHGQKQWAMDVVVTCAIGQDERPPEGADERLSLDELGLAGCDAMLQIIDPDENFGGQGYTQLCDTIEVVASNFGQTAEGGVAASSVTFRFTFQTASRSWREFAYPAS